MLFQIFTRSFPRLNVGLSESAFHPTVVSSSSFHTCCPLESRIKFRHTHKPFWRIKKTNKALDDPITFSNKSFIEEMKKVTFVNSRPNDSTLSTSPLKKELQPWPKGEWKPYTTRSGVIGRKIGVTPLWFKNGKIVPSTMIQIEDNHVVKYIPAEDYAKTIVAEKRIRPRVYFPSKSISKGVLVVGALSGNPEKFTKDYCGLFTETGLMPKKKLARFPVSSEAIIQPGTPLFASHFQPGQFVDVTGRSSRRGFHGVMKRHGFAGGPSDERGSTKFHRRPGCIGSGRQMGRVWPGKKLPGHVGGNRVKVIGLQILRINYEHNIIYLKGSVPGEQGEFVYLFDCKTMAKRFTESPRFFPTCSIEDQDDLPEEEYADMVHKFEDESITFVGEKID